MQCFGHGEIEGVFQTCETGCARIRRLLTRVSQFGLSLSNLRELYYQAQGFINCPCVREDFCNVGFEQNRVSTFAKPFDVLTSNACFEQFLEVVLWTEFVLLTRAFLLHSRVAQQV